MNILQLILDSLSPVFAALVEALAPAIHLLFDLLSSLLT